MRVFMLLNFYEESASWLAATISSAKGLVDHVVAIDGRYMLFPDGEAQSRSDQATTIVEIAQSCGMGLTLHRKNELWIGNEVEKRTHLFKLALLDATEDDWLFVLDADEVVTRCPGDTRKRLEETDLHAAYVTAWTREDQHDNPKKERAAQQFNWEQKSTFPVRKFFRALPGLHCERNHYTYVAGDGTKVWGNTTYEGHDVCPTLDITDFRVEHKTGFRSQHRRQAAKDYYQRRDQLAVESSYICGHCKREVPTTRSIPCDWKPHPEGLSSGWIDLCVVCANWQDRKNRADIMALGYDPAKVLFTGREEEKQKV